MNGNRKARKGAPRTPEDVAKDRLTFRVLRLIAGETAREAVEGTEKTDKNRRPLSQSTVRALRRPIKDGGTRYPRALTLIRLCEAHECRLEVVRKNGEIFE